MFKKFCLSSVTANAIEKTVTIGFNYDLEEKTVSTATVRLTESNGSILKYTVSVKGTEIILKLKDWPQNTSCFIVIDKSVENIAGDTLSQSYRNEIKFGVDITSRVNIKAPYNFEKLDNLRFEVDDTEDIGSYYVEIAEENLFYNLKYSGYIEEKVFAPVIPELEAGQYYVRFRVQKGEQYGVWSDVVTFIYQRICDDDEPEEEGPSANAEMPSAWDDIYLNRDDEANNVQNSSAQPAPVIPAVPPTIDFESELELLSGPQNGETPQSFIFEFDKELDILSGASVLVIKKEF